jgi:cytoskeletal protein RodZ
MKSLRRKDKPESTPSIEQQRAEILASMGAQLWAVRLEQGLSLEEMVALTRIPRRLLQAIEQANLAELPEPVYTQGLIRQFADALGLNGAEFSSTFPIGMNRVSLKPSWKTNGVDQLRPVHLYMLYIFVIFCSVSGLSGLLNTATSQVSYSQSNPKAQRQRLAQPQVARNNQTQQRQALSESFSSTHASQQVQIGVTLKEKSWIRVVADGKVQYEGELPQGTQRTWIAQGELIVKAGNAGGVLVSVNKQQAKQLGEPGKVKQVTIAANTAY